MTHSKHHKKSQPHRGLGKWQVWRWIHDGPRFDLEQLVPDKLLPRGSGSEVGEEENRRDDARLRDGPVKGEPSEKDKGEKGKGEKGSGENRKARGNEDGERHKSKKEQEQDQAIDNAKEREKADRPGWAEFIFTRHNWRKQSRYAPLVAAVFAPLATLLDIPALSQHWYDLNGDPAPDPVASLVLSAVGLTLNVMANFFLILRFSSKSRWWWRHATTWSLLFWIAKTIVAAINLILFGILTRNSPGYSYAEGFWCAVISIIDAGIISIALLIHYFWAFRKHEDNNEVRSEGKRFMLSVTFFLAVLGIQALVFSKIEGWVYLDAIYFSVQVALTIGYGDFTPSTAAGKVLIFPFAILTISQLGNEISLILGFIQNRAEERRSRWRRRYERAMHEEANQLRPKASLMEEMALIYQINKRENMMSQIYDLGWSALSLIIFWMVGAAIFSSIEGWSFGNGVYAVMILSMTIGFGDYVPTQPASRVIFVVYALMAVPIVTSFAVQTITGLLSTYSRRTAMHESFIRDRKEVPDAFKPHSDFVLRAHESYSDMRKRLLGDFSVPEPPEIPDDADADDGAVAADAVGVDCKPASDCPDDAGDDDNILKRLPTSESGEPPKYSSAGEDEDEDKDSQDHKRGTDKTEDSGRPTDTQSESDVVVDFHYKQQLHERPHAPTRRTEPFPPRATPPESPRLFGDSANPDLEEYRKQQDQSKKKIPRGGIKVTKQLSERKNLFFPQMEYGDGYNERETKYREEFHKMQDIMARRKQRLKSAGKEMINHQKQHDEQRVDPVDPNGQKDEDDAVAEEKEEKEEDDKTAASGSTASTGHPHPGAHSHKGKGKRKPSRSGTKDTKGAEDDEDGHSQYDDDCDWQQLHLDLTKQLMELTVRLEAEARQLIVDSMEPSVARTLLLADRNVQIRDVKALRGDDVNILEIWRGEQKKDQEDTKRLGKYGDENSPAARLERVKRYRNTFAEVLVVGSILQQLKGEEWGQFVRLNEKYREHRENEDEMPQPFGNKNLLGDDPGVVEEMAHKVGKMVTV